MSFVYMNLDAQTRALMVAEIDRDIAANQIYISDNLNPQGITLFASLLRTAAVNGTDASLASAIRPLLNSHAKPRKLKSGGLSKPPMMRIDAHEMLAEGEFNRFYIRALCLRAIQSGVASVEVYRAKPVENPRSESISKIGTFVLAQRLLDDLRTHVGVDTALGLPPGPNSGLSIRL
jgi:hypothetical protein